MPATQPEVPTLDDTRVEEQGNPPPETISGVIENLAETEAHKDFLVDAPTKNAETWVLSVTYQRTLVPQPQLYESLLEPQRNLILAYLIEIRLPLSNLQKAPRLLKSFLMKLVEMKVLP